MKTSNYPNKASSIASKKTNNAKKAAKKTSTTAGCSAVFHKLDPKVHAKRLEQRRRAIQYGKNTTGYHEYLQQVPLDKRKSRSMKHPATPDYQLDIPTKRWQGMVKAWRKALHQYDPADLQKAFAEVAAVEEEIKNTEESTTTTVKGQELALAKERGLLVDTTASPTSVADKLLDQWEAAADDDLEDAILDDSDDDML